MSSRRWRARTGPAADRRPRAPACCRACRGDALGDGARRRARGARERRRRRRRRLLLGATSCSAGRRPASSSARLPRSARCARTRWRARVRIDKLSLAALEATLRLHRDPERAARGRPGAARCSPPASGARRARGAAARRHRGGRPGGQHGADRAGVGPRRRRLAAAAGARGPGRRGRVAAPAPTRCTRGCAAATRAIVARVHDDAVLLDPRTIVRGRGRVRRARRASPRCVRWHDRPRRSPSARPGHIDHGKTSLIEALTGVDTDRLPEERERGISIELGFARLDAAVRALAERRRRARARALRAHHGRRARPASTSSCWSSRRTTA